MFLIQIYIYKIIDIYKIVSQHNDVPADGNMGGKKSEVRSVELGKDNDQNANAKKAGCGSCN